MQVSVGLELRLDSLLLVGGYFFAHQLSVCSYVIVQRAEGIFP